MTLLRLSSEMLLVSGADWDQKASAAIGFIKSCEKNLTSL
jgi:hypothetical protein